MVVPTMLDTLGAGERIGNVGGIANLLREHHMAGGSAPFASVHQTPTAGVELSGAFVSVVILTASRSSFGHARAPRLAARGGNIWHPA